MLIGYMRVSKADGSQVLDVKRNGLGRELCAELGITRQTLCRHVDPQSQLRPGGEWLLGCKRQSAPGLASVIDAAA